MSRLKANFVDKYKVNSGKQIESDMMQWQTDILNGDDSAVLLTDFALLTYRPLGKKQVDGLGSCVTKVQGYQVVVIERDRTSVVCAYSPLAKCLIGTYDYPRGYGPVRIPFRYGLTSMAVQEIGLDPLDDDTTKRLMLAGTGTGTRYYAQLCLEKRASNNANNYTRWLCQDKKIEDPLLAMVSLINIQPIEERKRILDVYDSYGTIDTLVGDALNHLDKFRTL
jgi:hypothetical protein